MTISLPPRGEGLFVGSSYPHLQAFVGQVTLEIGIARQKVYFQLLGPANSSGRIIAIAHQPGAGHLILNAVINDPPDPVQPPTLNGTFTLEFGDGSELEGVFQTTFSRGT